MTSTLVETINTTIDDMVTDFFYYARKEDEELPLGEIEREVSMGHISADDIIARFAEGVKERLEKK